MAEIDVLRNEVRALRTVVLVLSGVCALALLGLGTQRWPKESFGEITVHRINLIDNDGTLRLVISNKDTMPPPMMHGKAFGVGHRSIANMPSFVFYNAQGDEQGGFRWDGAGSASGSYRQLMAMSFDQFEQNDDMVLDFEDSNIGRGAGLWAGEHSEKTPLDRLLQQPGITPQTIARREEARERFFSGYNPDGSMVRLSDAQGRLRLLMSVDKNGEPKIDFFDQNGRITRQLP